MLTVTNMRRMCKAIVKVADKMIEDNFDCPFCGGTNLHQQSCEYVYAKSYLVHDKIRRMKMLVEMIEKDLNVKVTMNSEGAIVDCDIN